MQLPLSSLCRMLPNVLTTYQGISRGLGAQSFLVDSSCDPRRVKLKPLPMTQAVSGGTKPRTEMLLSLRASHEPWGKTSVLPGSG